jgi:uncharacterized damage-inducible protein DinB
MKLSEIFLGEFAHEMISTRKTLERVPEDKFDWRPHPKSMTLGRLAGHIAELPGLAPLVVQRECFDFAPPGGPAYEAFQPKSRKELLEVFEKNVETAREAVAPVGDEHLMVRWTLLSGGKTIFAMPRDAVLRTMVLNHMIHHRAQLGVYLRLNDIAVPSVYGPSADDPGM